MQLRSAFNISHKDVVSFVGGGGKTTAMFRLADELVAAGMRVVTTTTTRIFAAQIKLAPYHIRVGSGRLETGELIEALRDHPHVLIIGQTSEEGKAFGVDPSQVDHLIALDQVDAVINEADGSRMRPFKAPGDHEPVIPSSTTLLVPVVGIDIVGESLDDEHVHRAARTAEILNIPMGTNLEPAHIARVLAHREGGLKNKPSAARAIPLINKVASPAQLGAAREIAKQLLQHDDVDAVAMGAVKDTATPIRELRERVSAIILAAGGSTRMEGALKQLLPWGEATLVQHTWMVVQRAGFSEALVVVGNRANEVTKALDGTGAHVVFNPDWANGRASSIRVGLDAIRDKSAAALFINADQPFLSTDALDAILDHFAATRAPIIVPTFQGKPGSPVLFTRRYFDELKTLEGDVGGKQLFDQHLAEVSFLAIDDLEAGIDVDTPEQYEAALHRRTTYEE